MVVRADGKPLGHWIGIRKGWEEMGKPLGEVLVPLPISLMRTHSLLIGATGSGKSTAIHHLIAQDVLTGHPFIVLDMRGDLVNAALEICAGYVPPSSIALFDLREKERPLGFNPLFGSGEPHFRALGVLDVVASESDSWGVQLAESLRMAVMLLAETVCPLTDIEKLFFNAGFRELLISKCQNEQVVGFWNRYGAQNADRQLAMATPVLNKVSILFASESLRRTLGNPKPLDLGRHLNQPGSVTLISLAADELHSAGRMFGSMMLSSITREVFSRVNIPEGKRNPVHLYVDEFEHFGTKEFENILAEGRRFGLSLILAHQTLSQLNPKIRSMILNNVGVKLVFRTGREDAQVLSKDLCGDPKALDLTQLATGEAILSTRHEGPIVVEINAPLFTDVGRRSYEAQEFTRAIKARHPDWTTPAPIIVPQPKSESAPVVQSATDAGQEADLGDWL